MIFDLVAAIVAAAPSGLVLLLGLGAAGWLFTRSAAPAALLLLAILAMAASLLVDVGTAAMWSFQLTFGLDPDLLSTVTSLLGASIQGLGVVLALIAAAIGPAPAREVE